MYKQGTSRLAETMPQKVSGKPKKSTGSRKPRQQAKSRVQNAFSIAQEEPDFSDNDEPNADFVKGLRHGEDEEIDSDEAFDTEDEAKFDSFTFRGSSKGAKRAEAATSKPKLLDLAEEEVETASESYSDEESASDFELDDGKDLIDLSDMLGNTQAVQTEPASTKSLALEEIPYAQYDSADDSAPSASGPSDESFSSNSYSSDDEEEKDLVSFVEKLDTKRKRVDDHVKSTKRRQAAKDSMEMRPESEFNVSNTSQKLRLEDLLTSVEPKTLKALKKTQTLSAPLARPLQERLNRSAAYETVKGEITKWQPAVKQLREATTLKFPLHEPAPTKINNNLLASTFEPTNALENKIDTILEDSGMKTEQQVTSLEDFEMAKLTVEEVKKRRAELAMMRDLMFRQEIKAKRQNKIKSKAYRKVHRREKLKLQEAMEDALGEDTSLRDAELRARERMELRHKNTGKWARKMLGRADHGEGSRAAITEQLQRGEELERKMLGQDDASDSDVQEEDLPELPRSGVFAMKFMREADQREADIDEAEEETLTGRRKYTPSEAPSRTARQPAVEAAPLEEITEAGQTAEDPSESSGDENPWLAITTQKKRKAATKDSDKSVKFSSKISKVKQPQHLGRITQLDTTKTLKLRADNSDDDTPVFKQSELVAQAFAGDDVVAEFEAEKDKIKTEDAPQEVDITLPGWGCWIGNGAAPPKNPRKFVKHIEGLDPSKRKDAKLKHVIINEKRMKQAKPFLSTTVPFPFENKEQYERSLRMPIGPEWATRSTFQRSIVPRTTIKQGAVIAPMSRK